MHDSPGDLPAVGGYHCGRKSRPALKDGRRVVHDGSIRTGGLRAVEIVSPILKGENGIGQVKTVCAWLKRVGAKVNRSTGLHVHVGVQHTPDNLKRVVTAVANFEKAIYATTGTKARERGNYCARCKESGSPARRTGSVDRYRVLNVMTRGQTVEFRAFAGTTNFLKIVGYVRLSVALVEKALTIKKLPPWTAKPVIPTSPIKRGGDGLTTLNRFFYWSGWTKDGRSGSTAWWARTPARS